jgi:hypothetical protein
MMLVARMSQIAEVSIVDSSDLPEINSAGQTNTKAWGELKSNWTSITPNPY